MGDFFSTVIMAVGMFGFTLLVIKLMDAAEVIVCGRCDHAYKYHGEYGCSYVVRQIKNGSYIGAKGQPCSCDGWDNGPPTYRK